MLNGRPQIEAFLSHSFKDAKLEKDFKTLATKPALDQLIKDEVTSIVATKKMSGKAKTTFEQNPQLNQAQV